MLLNFLMIRKNNKNLTYETHYQTNNKAHGKIRNKNKNTQTYELLNHETKCLICVFKRSWYIYIMVELCMSKLIITT